MPEDAWTLEVSSGSPFTAAALDQGAAIAESWATRRTDALELCEGRLARCLSQLVDLPLTGVTCEHDVVKGLRRPLLRK